MLLFHAGKEVHEIYETLSPTADEDYDNVKLKLTTQFERSRNETFEVYHFRSVVRA